MARVAFVGLGVMGAPMAGHLASSGHDVVVYNRTAAKSEAWVALHGGVAAPTPAAAAHDRDIIFACVGNDDDLRAVTVGRDGAFSTMRPGACFVDHTTASANVARELASEAKRRGIGFVDAPVSGGQAGAKNGTLTIMCGGEPAHYGAVEQVMGAYAKSCRLMGPSGAGQLTKMVNQICIAGLLQGLSEGIAFAQTAGLTVEDVLAVISKGAAQSWQMDNRGSTMAQDAFDFGFAVDLMRKDLSICLAEARSNGAQLPVTALVDQFYAQVQMMGGGRWDTSSLVARLRHQ